MKSRIGQWGNSLALRIPRHIVEEMAIAINDEVDCYVENGKLVLEVVCPKEYMLDDLLSQDIEDEPEIYWGNPQGKEVW